MTAKVQMYFTSVPSALSVHIQKMHLYLFVSLIKFFSQNKKSINNHIQALTIISYFCFLMCISGPDVKYCWSVNYATRRICAPEGSSVNISSEYSHPDNQQPKSEVWYKIKGRGKGGGAELIEATGRVEYHDSKRNHHVLRIKNLTKNDSAEYTFREPQQYDLPGVTLVVTGNSLE